MAETLVTDGMRLSPPEPSMLDMRNAILSADQADFGGANEADIWEVFRARGMGYFAGVVDGDDTDPIEDFTPTPVDGGPTGTVTGVVTAGARQAPDRGRGGRGSGAFRPATRRSPT